jgi:type II secretory pathway predicted ATPase ExeA
MNGAFKDILMYERFYQLTTNPFRLEPDPNFCFSHSGYKRAREYLEYALDQGEGFVMVTGRPGTGKTLLLETFLKEIDTSNVIARRIAVSNYAGDDLLRAVAYAYEIDAAELDKATLRHRIHEYFIRQEQVGRRVLLIIDEAQALQHTALEELRILADLQTQSRLMLQLFLVGQESLQDLMCSPDMEQFQQRVIANYQLAPLNLQDTRSYIEHRLLQAGWKCDPEFSGDAVLSIYQLSHGVPRHINKICNRLLLLGFGKGSHAFEEQDVQEISAEMHDERLTPLEVGQATSYDADNIANIAEIRDGLISIDDLEIRTDKVDANASGLSEASRQSAIMKEQFIDRHHNDPAAWNIQQASSADPIAEPVTERYISRFKWRETLVATAAMLTITAISIAVLPSILGETAGKDRLSRADHQTREIQDEAVPERQEDVAQVADSGVADTTVPGEEIAVPADTATVSWADNPEETQLLDDELQVVVAEMPERAETIDEYGPPSAGNMERDLLPQEEQQAVVAGVMPIVSVAESVEPGHAETIEQLLSKGQQSLDDFRLLTPEEDNAYDYYRAVLLLDPANDDANEGIQEIVDRYITLVRTAAAQHENARAKRYVTRGLSIQPANRELLALQDSIDRAIQSASADTGTVAQGEGASLETASSGERPIQNSLIQGIRTFFEKRKAEARSGVVHTPAGWDD